jgi:hypothetical protein
MGELINYLEERAGDNLRAVAHYRGNEPELLYRRDTIEEEEAISQIKQIVDRLVTVGSRR